MSVDEIIAEVLRENEVTPKDARDRDIVARLIRCAYGKGYINALSEPEPDVESARQAVVRDMLRLPVI